MSGYPNQSYGNYSRPPPQPPYSQQSQGPSLHMSQYPSSQPSQNHYEQPAPSQYNRPPPPPRPGAPSYGQPPGQAPYGQQYQQPYQQPYQQAPRHNYGQPQYPPQGQYPGQGPSQGQYGQPQYSGGATQQGYGGAPPQQSYGGGGAQGSPQEVAAYKQALERAIDEKNLRRFFPPGSRQIDMIANKAPGQVNNICQQWKIPTEVGRDLARLGLYDIILFIDDSGSMQFEENGERIDDLKLVLSRVVQAATLFDEDGISIRFMNTELPEGLGDRITSEAQIQHIMQSVKFAGLTPMGRELKRKVIDGIVLRAARSNAMQKPVLVIAITDGQPAGDEPSPMAAFDTVRYAVNEVQRACGSFGGIAFQFAQVGNDVKAREFLGKLDSDPTVGSMVDCTSNFEQEQQEMMQQQPPVELTPTLWLVKLLLGAIDPSYDNKDESSNRPGGGQGQYGGPPPGQYGAPPPQGQYGASQQGQGQYGAPPPQGQYGASQQGQGQYGAPQGQYGAPQGQGQYGAPQGQYGAPPPQQQYGQQPQYGRPPPGQPPYPQQGGYGAPPPAPRY